MAMLPELPGDGDERHSGKQERKSRVQKPLLEGALRKHPLPQFQERGANGHYGHSVRLEMRPREGSPGRWDSEQSISTLEEVGFTILTDLVVSNEVVRAHALNLRRTEHPANIVNNLNVSWCCLKRIYSKLRSVWPTLSTYFLQLKQLGCLHQVLELQSTLWHVV